MLLTRILYSVTPGPAMIRAVCELYFTPDHTLIYDYNLQFQWDYCVKIYHSQQWMNLNIMIPVHMCKFIIIILISAQ